MLNLTACALKYYTIEIATPYEAFIFLRLPVKPNLNPFVSLFNRHGLDFGMHWIRLATAFKRNLASRQFCFFCCQKKEPFDGGEPIC